jgi:hypothetical protein
LVGKPKGKNHLEDLNIDGKIILKWILNTQDGKVWNVFTRPVAGFHEHSTGNKHLGSIKCGEFK